MNTSNAYVASGLFATNIDDKERRIGFSVRMDIAAEEITQDRCICTLEVENDEVVFRCYVDGILAYSADYNTFCAAGGRLYCTSDNYVGANEDFDRWLEETMNMPWVEEDTNAEEDFQQIYDGSGEKILTADILSFHEPMTAGDDLENFPWEEAEAFLRELG